MDRTTYESKNVHLFIDKYLEFYGSASSVLLVQVWRMLSWSSCPSLSSWLLPGKGMLAWLQVHDRAVLHADSSSSRVIWKTIGEAEVQMKARETCKTGPPGTGLRRGPRAPVHHSVLQTWFLGKKQNLPWDGSNQSHWKGHGDKEVIHYDHLCTWSTITHMRAFIYLLSEMWIHSLIQSLHEAQSWRSYLCQVQMWLFIQR